MKQYEITFIVDPVLPGDEVSAAANMYIEQLKKEGCEIVHVQDWGLRQLQYPIKKRTSGFYYTVEFTSTTGEIINKMEVAFRRDERIIRFLSIALDKYAIQYNVDKRAGKIGGRKKKSDEKQAADAAEAAATAAETKDAE